MDEDLAAIVAADEEARAAVQTTRTAGLERVDQVRQGIDRSRAERFAALRAQAAQAVAAIDEQTARTIAEREAARAQSMAARRRAAEAVLEAAAEIYARIVIDGPERREPA